MAPRACSPRTSVPREQVMRADAHYGDSRLCRETCVAEAAVPRGTFATAPALSRGLERGRCASLRQRSLKETGLSASGLLHVRRQMRGSEALTTPGGTG